MIRVGIGYDVHSFALNRPLVLGGMEIPHSRGLAGHSDADVLVHAVCDALLGALGAGDLGVHFPDSDPAYKGASSLFLLGQVVHLVQKEGYAIQNVDTVIVADEPKLGPYKAEMRSNLAKILSLPEAGVNIKATSQEGLGFVGRREGISAQAICSLVKKTGNE